MAIGLDKALDHANHEAFYKNDFRMLQELNDCFSFDYLKCAASINKGNRKKTERVKGKIGSIVEGGECLFLTLTFTDDVLARTSEETRRRYVARFLKRQCSCYVANIDFGSKREREHYHALVYAPKVDYTKWHKYGAIKGERVRSTQNDAKRVSKYVTKLSRHALKETAGKGRRIIYSRNTVFLPPAFLFEDD